MVRRAFVLLLVVLAPAVSCADGKFYGREAVPPGIPYQRALLLFDGNREALVVQSKISPGGQGGASEFGWVIPVPAVPQLASTSSGDALQLFWSLARRTRPRVVSIKELLALAALAGFAIGSVSLLLSSLSRPAGRLSFFRRNRRRAEWIVVLSVLYLFLMTLTVTAGRAGDVDVVRSEPVGVYDASVVRSRDAGALRRWLVSHGFRFTEADTPVIDSYLKRGWCFVAARVSPDRAKGNRHYEGLADPLVLVFPCRQAVYPLALTGTAGIRTEVLLYVAAAQPVADDGRLRVRYRGTGNDRVATHICEEPAAPMARILSQPSWKLPYLTKLKGTLSPEEMKSDLVLSPDPSAREYRGWRLGL